MANGLCYDLARQVFDAKNKHRVFISPEIYAELYNKVAGKRETLSGQSLDWLIYRLSTGAILIHPVEKIKNASRDKDDNKIIECAVEAEADLIVTMDKDLLKLKRFRHIGIVHPKTFFYMLSASEK